MNTAYLIKTPSTILICIQTYAPYDNYSKILGISKKGALINNKGCVSHLVQCQVQITNRRTMATLKPLVRILTRDEDL